MVTRFTIRVMVQHQLPSSDNISISDGTLTSTVIGGLTAGLNYNFSLVTVLGSDSSNPQGPVAATPTSFTGCTTTGTLTDTDPDLFVYYDFNNDLEDQKDSYGDGRYDLTNTGGTITICSGLWLQQCRLL